MENLPETPLLEILSRLDDSADVARCRFVSKTFDSASHDVGWINLQCPLETFRKSRLRASNYPQFEVPFKSNFLKFLSTLRTVESVCISTWIPIEYVPVSEDKIFDDADDMCLSNGEFVMKWLPRVSESLKSLSISDFMFQAWAHPSNVLQLVSVYCCKLTDLKVKYVWLTLENLNPMPHLTSLTLEWIRLKDEDLNVLNNCFPNLQVLNLSVVQHKQSEIHLLKLKTCHWKVLKSPSRLTLITPNLTTLKLECSTITTLNIENSMLYPFRLALDQAEAFPVVNLEKLKTLCIESEHFGSLLFKFRIIETVENLTIDSRNMAPGDAQNTKFTLGKLFNVFPNVSSLCLKAGAWSELEAHYNPLGWGPWDGKDGFKVFCAYLLLDDPSVTFTHVAIVLNHCIGLSEVSFLIHRDVDCHVSQSFISECLDCWPGVTWRWGKWKGGMADSWISDGASTSTSQVICKKRTKKR